MEEHRAKEYLPKPVWFWLVIVFLCSCNSNMNAARASWSDQINAAYNIAIQEDRQAILVGVVATPSKAKDYRGDLQTRFTFSTPAGNLITVGMVDDNISSAKIDSTGSIKPSNTATKDVACISLVNVSPHQAIVASVPQATNILKSDAPIVYVGLVMCNQSAYPNTPIWEVTWLNKQSDQLVILVNAVDGAILN
jgi:hypothetical protein